MKDALETIHGSVVQHGKHNDRVYVMHLESAGERALLTAVETLVRRHGYRKVLARIPATSWERFKAAGFAREAEIPLFFSGRRDCYFVAKFRRGRHRTDEDFTALRRIVSAEILRRTRENGRRGALPVKRCSDGDAGELALFYRGAFSSYPFPIVEPAYLAEMMRRDVVYYCARNRGRIVAAAATEPNPVDRCAEMTDFATAPDWRKSGLAGTLLARMERDLEPTPIMTAFTIARAASPGMNRVFKRGGYTYAGLLVNNTQIGGRIESMSVWYKRLQGVESGGGSTVSSK